MKRMLTMLIAGISVAACVSAPSTEPSQNERTPASLGLDAKPASPIATRWWTDFGDAQLDKLVDDALSDNPVLQVALARMRKAQAELSSVRAQTYPLITGDAAEQREYLSKSYIIPPPYGGTTQWIGTAQASLSWSIDFWGKQKAQVDKARASAGAAALDAAAARLALAGAMVDTYVALSRAFVLNDVAEEAVRQHEAVLRLTASRVKSGLANKAAQSLAEAQLAMERETLLRTASAIELAKHEIAALAGRGADFYATIARPRLRADGLDLPKVIPADLLARRADIQAAKARIAQAAAGREEARKAFYPDINLLAFAGFAAVGLSPMFSASSLTYGAGPAIHLPIFDAGRLRAGLSSATADLDAAVADYNANVLGAVKETADALTQLRALEKRAVQQRIALSAAQDSFRLAQSRYRNGLSPLFDVLDAENTLLAARRQDAAIAADLAQARVALVMALGGGFDADTRLSTSEQESRHE